MTARTDRQHLYTLSTITGQFWSWCHMPKTVFEYSPDCLWQESFFGFNACACAYIVSFAHRLAYNHYASAHNATNAHAQGNGCAHWSTKVTLSSKAIGLDCLNQLPDGKFVWPVCPLEKNVFKSGTESGKSVSICLISIGMASAQFTSSTHPLLYYTETTRGLQLLTRLDCMLLWCEYTHVGHFAWCIEYHCAVTLLGVNPGGRPPWGPSESLILGPWSMSL